MAPQCSWVAQAECSSTLTEATVGMAGAAEMVAAEELAVAADGEVLEEMADLEVMGGRTVMGVLGRTEDQADPVATVATGVPEATAAMQPRGATRPTPGPSN